MTQVARTLVVLVLSLSTVCANWLPNWSVRNLLQKRVVLAEDKETKTRSFNLSCTWSDQINCYLDYFEHVPESEIKHFYRADEGCGSIVNKTLCVSDPECEWTHLVSSRVDGCYAKALETTINLCSRNPSPKRGSLCSVWKQMDRCARVQPRNQTSCRRLRKGKIRCQWQGGDCLLHPKTMIWMEFLEDDETARYVEKVHRYCDRSTSREQCEADHGIH
eukprot:g5676.t1